MALAGSGADLAVLAATVDVSEEVGVVTAADDVSVSGGSILPLDEALAAASGGAFSVTREAPKARTRIADVPSLANEEAAAEDTVDEEAAPPAILA